jgi:hypothetical protein
VHVDTNGHDLAETYVVDREEPTPDSVYPTIPSYSVIVNTGASGSQEFDLPPAAAGLRYTFACVVAQNIVIDPASGDRILSLTDAVNDSITAGTIGNSITLVAVDSTNWVAVAVVGTWTDTN